MSGAGSGAGSGVRLRVRRGDQISASISPGGEHWTEAGDITATLPRNVTVGLYVNSGTATFDHVIVSH